MMFKFKEANGNGTFDPTKIDQFDDRHFEFIRIGIHPVIDGMNTGYNFALRSDPVNDAESPSEFLEVKNGVLDVIARLGGVMPLIDDDKIAKMPDPKYDPLPLIREIIFRLPKGGVVFFEEEHGSRMLAKYMQENESRAPSLFPDPFGGITVVLNDLYRSRDVTVRFFPRM